MSIEHVAKYAGVSTATVSRVLNCVPVVSASTVKAVRAALTALNYDPIEIKRGPRPRHRRPVVANGTAGRTRSSAHRIALVTVGQYPETKRTLRLPVINAVVESITEAAKQNGAKVFLDDLPTLADVGRIIRNHEVDGAIVMLSDGPMDAMTELDPRLPIVWAMGGQAGPLQVDHISTNNLAVGYLGHQYLHRRGCSDVASLTADPTRRYAQQRRMALAGAASEAGHRSMAFIVSKDPHLADLYGRNTVACATLVELVDALASTSPRPEGLFIDRDATTAQVYPLLLKHGIQPRRDITIVSCDNEEVRLSSLYPRPPSIDLGTAEIGLRAVRRLMLRIANPDEPPVFIQAMPFLAPGADDNQSSDNHEAGATNSFLSVAINSPGMPMD